MGGYNYLVNPIVHNKIYTFYTNVSKKYVNTYTFELMEKNINDAYNSIFQIENGLPRRNPTIHRWKGKGYMANTKKWYFLYHINGNTIYVDDACHAQNMHESIDKMIASCIREYISKNRQLTESKVNLIRLNESEFYDMVCSIAKRVINEEYRITSTDEDFVFDNGKIGHSLMTLRDDAGGITRVIEDDGCYVPYQVTTDGKHVPQTHLYPELFNALKKLPNLPLH